MKRGYVYTFLFMVAITAVLVFALAAAYEGFKPAITANKDLQEQRAVLYALNLDQNLSDEQVVQEYDSKVAPQPLNGLEEVNGLPILAHVEDGQALAFAVPFEGSALWGSLRGYLGVTADLDQLTGLVFTYQNETPGLGGRIDEEWYKSQFRGLPIQEGGTIRYGGQPGYTLDAVTGATQTSQAVLRTLNKALENTVFAGEVE